MKNAVNNLLHRWGYHVANLTFRRRDLFGDVDFSRVHTQAQGQTTTSVEALFAIYKIVRHLVARKIQDAFVDCAAWRAGGSIAVMETLLRLRKDDREIVAFDLFDQGDAEGRSYWNAADFAHVQRQFMTGLILQNECI